MKGDPPTHTHTVSVIAQLNTFILGISVPCSIMSRGFSHSCNRKLMMFDMALSSSPGPPFCAERHTHRTIAILYRKTHTELSPFCTERPTQNYGHFVQKDTYRTTAILYIETHIELSSFCAERHTRNYRHFVQRDTHRTIAILYRIHIQN